MKKYFAELIGTMVLTLFGCGSAAVAGGALGTLGIALAFGLSIVAMAYVIGGVSGCHINPAVSLGVFLNKGISGKDFVCYLIFQFIGAIIGIAILYFFIAQSAGGSSVPDLQHLGQNGFEANSAVGLSMGGAFVVEVVLTFVFVLTVLGVTSSQKFGSVAGIVIGLTLAFVHIMGIPLTGTSVNPARSLAPALFLGGEALSQVWVFIVAPLVGAVIAALMFKAFKPKAEAAA
ncbi:MIP family channel protein [Christensenellaceae bacterium OttesenSCG-928-K19]|nr:MIP family channel protein [Christensenellaceae bacterium OttesenSCG-928-K19]